MRPSLVCSAIVASVAALGLAACSGQGAIPQSSSLNTAMTARVAAPIAQAPDIAPLALPEGLSADAVSPDATSPCDISKTFWYFHGSCLKLNVKAAGTTFNLKQFKGITAAFATGKNNATGTDPFIVGDAITPADVTGTFNKKTFKAIGAYGPRCFLKGTASTQKCPGKQVVYFLFANASKSTVAFNGTPQITVTTATTFPGKSCQLTVWFSNKAGTVFAWAFESPAAAVVGKKVTIKAQTLSSPLSFESNHFILWGVACQ